ncbi:MFS transporter [Mycobacterium sp. B14F4]|uniref:MFS transporter n=1 Tax=Mycobacterium sp. B14F4 TaxID=3153565 RepID=UPI00325ED962
MADAAWWGPPVLRRATIALATTQLISWGVLYYTFAVVAPVMAGQQGWSVPAVGGAFSVGILVSGLSARAAATLLGRLGPRSVMTAGSLLTAAGTTLWASASSVAMLYTAWTLIGIAMAATLYEPAIVVLAQIDSSRMRHTIATVTVAGGLASTVFVPLAQQLVTTLGWRGAVTALGLGGGALTAALHARFLPKRPAAHRRSQAPPRPLRRLRLAYMLEQASAVAATALVVTMLIDRGTDPRAAGLVLASGGVGKVVGRLVLTGRIGRASPEWLAAIAAACHGIALSSLLASTSAAWLLLAGLTSGAAAGTSSVLRPLIVSRHAPPDAFASTNARLHAFATVARAAGPLGIAGTATHVGWTAGWAIVVGGLAAAAGTFATIGSRSAPLRPATPSTPGAAPHSGRRRGR